MNKVAAILCLKIALALSPLSLAAVVYLAASETEDINQTQAQPVGAPSTDLIDFNHEPDLTIGEIRARKPESLAPNRNESYITRLTAQVLEQSHYARKPLDDEVSGAFLERYLNTLDSLNGLRMHFLQSDIEEFKEKYEDKLDDLTYRGDTSPARVIFERILERIDQRLAYIDKAIEEEEFDFTVDEEYALDRKDAPWPKDLEEAKTLWRKHLKYEVLQERLTKEKPEDLADTIRRRYVRMMRMFKDYDGEDVFELYLSSLTRVYDPHSDYMGPSQLENFAIGMKLSLGGIGALLRSEDGYCKVVSLVPGGPAAKSKKLKEDDKIIAVAQEGQPPVDVVDMKLSRIVEMIRGEKGSIVELTIIPAAATDPSVRETVKLVRDEVKLEDQEAKAQLIQLQGENGRERRIGVIDLPSFYADFGLDGKQQAEPKRTTQDVAKLIRKLKAEKAEGIILDLRRNGGGSLEEAINLTGLFIKEGPVVQVKGPVGPPIVNSDTDSGVLYEGPLIVLTSRFSASASEILAGALQDYGRALIVGDSSTHGKGTVQSLIQLEPYIRQMMRDPDSSGALKITIRKFYRASGSSTQKEGVIPDLVLPSPNNHADIGEKALENPLPWDDIPAADYIPVNQISPILEPLRELSEERIAQNEDFQFVKTEIERIEENRLKKSISLNEARRRQEKEESEERLKARKKELEARESPTEVVYEIPVERAGEPGLPEPKKAGEDDEEEPSLAGDDEERDDLDLPTVDFTMDEAKRILLDLIRLTQERALAVKN